MFRQFKFEESIYQTLEQVPISAQFKLEMLGLTLPPELWNQLALEERWVLCHMPMRSRGERECYCGYLAFLLKRQGAVLPEPFSAPPEKKVWEELSRLPSEVAEKTRELNLPLYWPDWIKLDDMERYTVYKLCKEKSDNLQIQQVVQEFLNLSNLPQSTLH